MKKGFTLVEIIISISLVLIIGVSATFFIVRKNSNNKLYEITKTVLEAANLYALTEKDELGNAYLNEVKKDKSGVKIPLSNLVNKGYIKEELKDEVIDLSNKGESYNYYVMLLNESENGYCNGDTFSLASWIDDDWEKEIYLCNNNGEPPVEETLYEHLINKNSTMENPLETKETFVEGEDYLLAIHLSPYEARSAGYYIYVLTNGLYWRTRSYDNALLLYYRGMVTDNYVELAGILFRIVSFNDKEIKLITDSRISDNYYNSAEGDGFSFKRDAEGIYTNNNFKSSKLKSTLDLWVQENIENVYPDKDLKEHFYKKTIFGEEYNSGAVFHYVGLLSEKEIEMIGHFREYEDDLPVYNPTYLVSEPNESKKTLLINHPSYNCPYFLLSSKLSGNSGGYGHAGTFGFGGFIQNCIDTSKYDTKYSSLGIRPVISLNIENIEFSGSGVKNNPYVFVPK